MADDWGGELVRERLWFDDGFTTIPNSWARDAMITHQARGLLVQLASHKAGYRVTIEGLVSGCLNGRDAVRSMVSELTVRGYLERTQFKQGNLRRYRYKLRDPHAPHGVDGQAEFPVAPAKSPSSGFREAGNPRAGNPSTENPTTIRTLVKNKDLRLTETTTENARKPVDNSPDARCVQGHKLIRNEQFCELGHWAPAEAIARQMIEGETP